MIKSDKLLLNRYLILKLLGRGGMGSVYLAKDTFWGDCHVAVKTINQDIFIRNTKEALLRFKSEYDIMTRLDHPNLIKVKTLEYDKYVKRYFIIMEYIEGKTLYQIMQEQKKFGLPETLDIIVNLLRALEFIHSREIIFRDLKPQNIIIRDNDVKLTDFGLSDIGNIKDRMIRGSIYYLAPEILSGKADIRIDIFSLGILFYTMLTGEHIIRGKTLSDCLTILENKEIYNRVTARSLPRIESKGIRSIISKMISYDRENRYDFCSEVISDINALKSVKCPYEFESKNTSTAYINESVFINRNKELRALIRNIYSRKGFYRLFLVTGDTGIGKTRLIQEFKKYCLLNDIEFYDCDAIESIKTPYYSIIQVLSQIMLKADSYLIEKYGEYLISIMPYNSILKKFFQHKPDLKYKKETINYIITGFLLDYALRQKSYTILCFNDFHWADENSIEVIEELQSRLSNDKKDSHLRVYITFRDDLALRISQFLSSIKEDSRTITRLQGFCQRDISDYITAIFGKNHIHKSLYESIPEILSIAGGNPLFLKEFIRFLVTEDIIKKDIFLWKINKNIENIKLPASIGEILSNRLLSLSLGTEEFNLLSILSLIEFELDINQIEFISRDLYKGNSAAFLLYLEKYDIVKSFKKENGVYFLISHRTIRAVIQDMIPDKMYLHSYIGEKIEILFGHEINDYFEILAFHFSNSQNTQKAFEYLVKAGDKAKKVYNSEKALSYYDKALNLDKEPINAEKIRIMIKKANALEFIGKTDESFNIAQQCLNYSIKARDPFLISLSRKLMASNYRKYGEAGKAIKELEGIIDYFAEINDKKHLAEIYCELGINYHYLADYNKAIEFYSKYEALSYEAGDKNQYSKAIGNIGNTFYNRGDYDKALHYYQIQKNICQEIGDKYGYGYAVGNMGSIYYYKGEYDKAIECFEQKKKICEEVGDKRGYAHIIGNIGVYYHYKGNYEKAMEYYIIQRDTCIQTGDKRVLCNTLGNMGNVFFHQEKYKKAMECYEAKRDLALEIGHKIGYSNAIGNMGSIHFTRGNYDLAMECYNIQMKICEELEDKSGYGYSIGNIGNIYENMGKFDKALDCYQKKHQICKDLNDQKGIINAVGNMGSIYFELKDHDKALSCFDSAIHIARRYNLHDSLPHLLHIRAELLFADGNTKEAKLCNDEALEILEKYGNSDLRFSAEILKIKINAREDNAKSYEQLLSLLGQYKDKDKPKSADIYYELWAISNNNEHRKKAYRLYAQLYKSTPNYSYSEKMKELMQSGLHIK